MEEHPRHCHGRWGMWKDPRTRSGRRGATSWSSRSLAPSSISLDGLYISALYLCSRWPLAPDGRSSRSLWGKRSLKLWRRAWGGNQVLILSPANLLRLPPRSRGFPPHCPSVAVSVPCSHFSGPWGWMGKEGWMGLAPAEAVADPLLCCRRSKLRSTRPGSGRASREANRWRKPRYAARSPSALLGGGGGYVGSAPRLVLLPTSGL